MSPDEKPISLAASTSFDGVGQDDRAAEIKMATDPATALCAAKTRAL